jgi:DNA-binding NarL/FixJ family response regulator
MTLQMPAVACLRREPGRARDHHHPLSDASSAAEASSAADAAIETAARASPGAVLADLWQDILDTRLVLASEGTGPGGRYVRCRVAQGVPSRGSPLSRVETAVLIRVLDGEQQKAVAVDLGMACSTTSKWHTEALKKLRLNAGPIPLPLVVAAQTWASGKPPPVDARRETIFDEGSEFVVLTVRMPDASADPRLTRAEAEVAQALIEGQSRWEIAARRSTSTQTVACQLRGIFSKLRVGGRCALIKHGLAAGWFR